MDPNSTDISTIQATSSLESLSIAPNQELTEAVNEEDAEHHHPTRLSDIAEEEDKDETASCTSWQNITKDGELDPAGNDNPTRKEEVEERSRSPADYNTFFRAAVEGDVDVLVTKLDRGLDIEHETRKGFTALVMAIMEEHVPVVKFLLSRGASPTHRVKELPPLVHALMRNKHSIELMQLLLDHGAPLKSISGADDKDALHWASCGGKVEAVEFLLNQGMDVERKCRRGFNPLLLAAETGHTEVAEVLLNHGAKLDVTSDNGGTPLMWAACHDRVEAVKFFLDKHVDINWTDNYGQDALFLASWTGALAPVNFLLQNGVDANKTSSNPELDLENITPVMMASHQGHYKVLKALIDHGCDLTVKDNHGQTALDKALETESLETVQLLLEALGGSDYPKNSVALQIAMSNGHSVIKPLMAVATLMYQRVQEENKNPGKYDWISWALEEGGTLLKENALFKLLHAALEDQDVDMLNVLIREGLDVDAPLQSGFTPLTFAVAHRNIAMIKAFVDAGADVSKSGKHGITAFEEAFELMKNPHDTEILGLLLASPSCRINTGLDIKSSPFSFVLTKVDRWDCKELILRMINAVQDVNADRCKDGSTLLHVAIMRGREEYIDILLEKGADLEAPDTHEVTPLLLACQRNAKMIPHLLLRGAALHIRYRGNAGAMHTAAAGGNVDSLKFLLDFGLDIESPTSKGYPPLACALTWGNEDAALFLMEKGANVKWVTTKGYTALHFAARHKLERVVRELIEQGADVHAKDSQQWTPLHDAVASGNPEVAQMLLNAGANIEAPVFNNERPLHIALINEKVSTALTLLENGADIKAKASKNRSVLHLACEYNLFSLAKALLEKGASVSDIDDDTWTPLCCSGDPEITDLLLSHGADVHYEDKDKWTPLHQSVSNAESGNTMTLLIAGANPDVRTTDDGLDVWERASRLEDGKHFVMLLENEMRWRKRFGLRRRGEVLGEDREIVVVD